MSEKPRLKDSDEILNSLGRAASNALGPENRSQNNSMRRRRGRPAVPPGEEGPALDFGKYEIPAADESANPGDEKSGDSFMPADETVPDWILAQMPPRGEGLVEPQTGPQLPEPDTQPKRRGRGRPPVKRVPQAQADRASPAPAEMESVPTPSFSAPSPPIVDDAPVVREYEFPRMTREELKAEDAVKEYSFESFDEQVDAEPPKAPLKPSPSEIAPARKKDGDPRSRLLVDEDERDVFMKELSLRFERQFAEKFETPIDEIPGDPDKQLPDIPDFWNSPKKNEAASQTNIMSDEPDESVLAPEAEEFMGRFIDETLEEEETRSREFKDTLAQKFMRERERYLKELDIAAERDDARREELPPEPEPVKTPRRKLDFQIVPEMHLQKGEEPPAPPVTYTRDARLRPQAENGQYDGDGPAGETTAHRFSPSSQPASKKTAEQLLNELAAQAKAAEERLGTGRQPDISRAAVSLPAVKTQSAPVQASQKRYEIPKRRIVTKQAVFFTAAAIMLMFTVVIWTLRDQIFTPKSPVVQSSEALADSQADSTTLTIYEDRRFSERGDYSDVLVKRPNVSVSNLSVKNLLVVSDIETTGEVSLSDVSVDGAIHVKSCAANVLNLTDVKAPRVVINNTSAQMLVRVSGKSDIGEIELKTPGTIEQTGLLDDVLGVRGVVTGPEVAGGTMSATLTGLNLPSLATSGSTVLTFNDTYVSGMTSNGSLSIDGTGRIINLSIGSEGSGFASASGVFAQPLDQGDSVKPLAVNPTVPATAAIRPMAITETRPNPLMVILKGVSISNLNIRNTGDINIGTSVDAMTVSDSVSISGGGSIASMTVNQKFGNSRLSIDVSGPSVPTLITEAEAKIIVTGSGKVNNLICNASTYAFGNKINNMVVNADGCIYENMPDRITRSEGVRPPESVAENPNLDYNAAASSTALDSDATPFGAESEVGTTCGHSRESGAFINGDGSKSSPFEVTTPAQLAHVASHLNSYFIQANDIDIADDSDFSGGFPPIAPEDDPFSGDYDGRGWAIYNLRVITDKKNAGLFGSNVGTIQNVHILSGEINATLNQSAYVGAITGFCYDEGQVINCSNRAKVTGKLAYVGGIVGYNYGGRIKDCYNAAKITAESEAGGIVGVNRQNAIVAGCYNAGTISAKSPAGAIAGTNDARIINCYYLEDTAEAGIGFGDGAADVRTSEEMQSDKMIDDLAAGNLDSLWKKGADGEGSYNYPVLAKPQSTP